MFSLIYLENFDVVVAGPFMLEAQYLSNQVRKFNNSKCLLEFDDAIISPDSYYIYKFDGEDFKQSCYVSCTGNDGSGYELYTVCRGDNNTVVIGGASGRVSVYSP